MSNALDRLNHSHHGAITYAGICMPSRTRSMLRADRKFRHISLMDGDADDVLLHLQQLGWLYVDIQIRARHIPTHTNAIYSIEELLAGRPLPPTLPH